MFLDRSLKGLLVVPDHLIRGFTEFHKGPLLREALEENDTEAPEIGPSPVILTRTLR